MTLNTKDSQKSFLFGAGDGKTTRRMNQLDILTCRYPDNHKLDLGDFKIWIIRQHALFWYLEGECVLIFRWHSRQLAIAASPRTARMPGAGKGVEHSEHVGWK